MEIYQVSSLSAYHVSLKPRDAYGAIMFSNVPNFKGLLGTPGGMSWQNHLSATVYCTAAAESEAE